MKEFIFLIISILGFFNIKEDYLNDNNNVIPSALSFVENREAFNTVGIGNNSIITFDENLAFDVISLTGYKGNEYSIKEGDYGAIIEFKGASFDIKHTGSIKPSVYSIKDVELRTINENQYLFIEKMDKVKSGNIRIYTDKDAENVLKIAVPKKDNPYEYKVVIDCGHGDFDYGANYKGVNEKDIVLDIGLRMKEKLKNEGIEVFYTREKDIFVPLIDRSVFSNNLNADVFVSIHSNANKKKNISGISTYRYNNSVNNYNLSYCVQKSLMNEFKGSEDLGTLIDNFSVLRNTNAPSILVEFMFVSNEKDREKLKDNSVRERCSIALVSGITEYINALKKHT